MKNKSADVKRRMINAAMEWAATVLLPNTIPSLGITGVLIETIAYTTAALAQHEPQPSDSDSAMDSENPLGSDRPFSPSIEEYPI